MNYTEEEKALALRYVEEKFGTEDLQETAVLMEIWLDGYMFGKAIEQQIDIIEKTSFAGIGTGIDHFCPSCDNDCLRLGSNYCNECGVKLIWK